MSTKLLRSAGAFGVLVLTFAAAPSAFAAGSVFGGSTSGYEPIVLNGDAKAKKLKSAVIAVEATCDDGTYFPIARTVVPRKSSPGFDPGPDDLVVKRNGKGRFSGQTTDIFGGGGMTAAAETTFAGKLKAHRASGTIQLDVAIFDAQANLKGECHTGKLTWAATRAPGRVYGGSSSQDEPVVIRLDAKHKKVSDVLAGWESESCTPDGAVRFGERFTNFPLHAGSFGDAFDQTYDIADGGKRTFAYTVGGKVGRRSSTGTLHVGMTETDAAGATAMTCDSGDVSWKAVTG